MTSILIAAFGGLVLGLIGGIAIGMGLALRIQTAEREHDQQKQRQDKIDRICSRHHNPLG